LPSCAEYRLRLRGNYRDKDMPQYESISRYSIRYDISCHR